MSRPIISVELYRENSDNMCCLCNRESPSIVITMGRQYQRNRSAMGIVLCYDCFNDLKDKIKSLDDDLK